MPSLCRFIKQCDVDLHLVSMPFLSPCTLALLCVGLLLNVGRTSDGRVLLRVRVGLRHEVLEVDRRLLILVGDV